MSATRPILTITYRTMVKTVFSEALKNVFTGFYPETEFQNLRVFPEYPQEDIQPPLVVIRYHPAENRAVGIGHLEYFPDQTGFVRPWMRRIFEGEIEFECQAKTPLSRDIMVDSIVEILAFGRMSPNLTGFFTSVYGDPDAAYSLNAYLIQLHANTDIVRESPDGTDAAPWRGEDTLIYNGSVIVPVWGSFYNMAPSTAPAPLVEAIELFPYIEGETPPDPANSPGIWLYTNFTTDAGTVVGKAMILGRDS